MVVLAVLVEAREEVRIDLGGGPFDPPVHLVRHRSGGSASCPLSLPALSTLGIGHMPVPV